MSDIDTLVRDTSTQDGLPDSWAPEINDLQKYRDSLKVMAERVSQAEFMWAKSLEPPRTSPRSPAQRSQPRKYSKSNRPAPLAKPLLPKRIRTDMAMPSPDPFQLLSPAVLSDEEPVSPASERSTTLTSPGSPDSQSTQSLKRSRNNGSAGLPSPGPDVHESLLQAEGILQDMLRTLAKTLDGARSLTRENAAADEDFVVKAQQITRRVRDTRSSVQALINKARGQSRRGSNDEKIFKNPTFHIIVSDVAADPKGFLVNLFSQLKSWAQAINEERGDIAVAHKGRRLPTPE
ncbi:MAG: hypothetical protein Q9159_004929 [Coniocarpon cinnabarinum]